MNLLKYNPSPYLASRKSIISTQLSSIDLELTSRCNNTCIHCYINTPENDKNQKKQELSTSAIKQILTDAATLGCIGVRLTGGEPLLRKDFSDIYICARKLGLKVTLFTNATLITKKIATLFKKIPPLEKIEISFYGMEKKTYESITKKPGTFKDAQNGINMLMKYKVPFIVKNVLLPQNIHEYNQFTKWAQQFSSNKFTSPYSYYLTLRGKRDNDKKNASIKALRLPFKQIEKATFKNKELFIQQMQDFLKKFSDIPGKKLFSCGAGKKISIDSNGNIQPCLLLRHPQYIFPIKKYSIKSCLETHFKKLTTIIATNKKYLHRCANCFLYNYCEQCPAQSWMEHGTLDAPIEYFCKNTHETAYFLGVLKKPEKSWAITNWKERINKFITS